MCSVAATLAHRLQSLTQRHHWLPLATLGVVCVLSIAARVAWLGEPCRTPCRSAGDHVLVFDEVYYVNAARVIAGLRPPAGMPYATAPAGDDPNSEHPQLAKLIIAGSIELFGDGPLAWRLGSVLFGTLSILGMYVLVRSAAGGRWLGVGAAALMASDNLLLVHERIGTLDVYALAAMIWGVAMYLRGRRLLAGIVIGIGACTKLVALYALPVLALFELLRLVSARAGPSALAGSPRQPRIVGRAAARIAACTVTAATTFIALLAVLDRVAPPYDPNKHRLVAAGPFAHLAHMLSYAASQTSPGGPRGIASYPWEWLGDYKPIVYLYINPAQPSRGLEHVHPAAHFLGMVSPPILILALPALALAVRSLLRGRLRPERIRDVGLLGLAWFVGTFVPFELLSVIWSRTSYLYYMVVVMPGIYILVADLVARVSPRPWVTVAWITLVGLAAVAMYPFTPIP